MPDIRLQSLKVSRGVYLLDTARSEPTAPTGSMSKRTTSSRWRSMTSIFLSLWMLRELRYMTDEGGYGMAWIGELTIAV